MLPLFHNSLHIVLGPDKVVLLSMGKGFRRHVQEQTILACPQTEPDFSWQPALTVLETWLLEHQQPRSDVELILSNRFVRYSLIPWSDDVQTEREELALAQAVFTDTYGDLLRDWTITVVDAGYQHSKLAAAIDTKLLNSIKRICAVSNMNLHSVEPWLTVTYNHFIAQIEADSCLFATEESGQLVTLTFHNKALSSVRKDVVTGTEQLQSCLQRELLFDGLEVGSPLYLYSENPHLQSSTVSGSPVHILRGSKECGYFEIALTRNPHKSLVLNFHPRRFTGSRSGFGLLATSVFLAVCLAYFYVNFYVEHQKIQKEFERLSAVNQLARNQAADPKMTDTLQHAAGVIDQLAFPWNKLFVTLESATVNDVLLLGMQPDLQTGVITLSGEAKNWHAMVVYLRRLKEERFFTDVQLSSHQILQSDPQKPVRFVFLCEWGKVSH